tara:strand:+ start:45758 stop:47848 length:2091 start_codon:yes stop_codon:yes gene_type:complete
MMKRMRFGGLLLCASLLLPNAAPQLMQPAQAGTFQAPNASEAGLIRSKIRAAQFLSKATFGPTQSDIDELGLRISQIGYRAACEEWIDDQMSMNIGQSSYFPAGQTHEGMARAMVARNGHALDAQNGSALPNYRYEAWWHIALTSEDQLRQRVAWALSQIFVIGDTGNQFNNRNIYNIRQTGTPAERSIPLWLGMSNYYDMLVSHAFGDYRDILQDMTYHPVMGVWLSSAGNRKALKQNGEVVRFPDENYAREIQQLFSVGLYLMHSDGRFVKDANGDLIPTYQNDGITEMARVFTGLHYSDGNNNDNDFNTQNGRRTFGRPMAVNGNQHDNNRNYNEQANPPLSKTIFKGTDYAQTITLPGNYNSLSNANKHAAAKADIDAALDIIAAHPNVAPFISRLLIQRLVKSNPSRAYIRRVTSQWESSGGNLGAVIKAILLDPELLRGQRTVRARNDDGSYRVDVVSRGTEYSRLREPVNRATSFIRAMEPTSNDDDEWFILPQLRDDFGQFPYRSPTVFNFYLPDYQSVDLVNYVPSRRLPYGSLFTPEFEIINAVTAVRTNDRLKGWCRSGWTQFNINHGQATGATARPEARRTIRLTFDLADEIAMGSDDSSPGHDYDNPAHNDGHMKDLLEKYDLLLCNGSMHEDTKRLIFEGLATTPRETTGQGNHPANLRRGANRVENMLLAILTSPDCAVEE